MEVIREYILSVTAASMISGILTVLLDKKGTAGAMGKMFCGVFLAITLIRPLGELSFDSVTDWLTEYERQGNQYAVEGEALKNDSVREIIKSRCEAYIQDVGADMKLTLRAQVRLDTQSPYAPVSVTIFGVVPPYNKAVLEEMLERDFAVAKEQIQWK